jgi:predicted DNA-binding transcriptional regulator AlpA
MMNRPYQPLLLPPVTPWDLPDVLAEVLASPSPLPGFPVDPSQWEAIRAGLAALRQGLTTPARRRGTLEAYWEAWHDWDDDTWTMVAAVADRLTGGCPCRAILTTPWVDLAALEATTHVCSIIFPFTAWRFLTEYPMRLPPLATLGVMALGWPVPANETAVRFVRQARAALEGRAPPPKPSDDDAPMWLGGIVRVLAEDAGTTITVGLFVDPEGDDPLRPAGWVVSPVMEAHILGIGGNTASARVLERVLRWTARTLWGLRIPTGRRPGRVYTPEEFVHKAVAVVRNIGVHRRPPDWLIAQRLGISRATFWRLMAEAHLPDIEALYRLVREAKAENF